MTRPHVPRPGCSAARTHPHATTCPDAKPGSGDESRTTTLLTERCQHGQEAGTEPAPGVRESVHIHCPHRTPF